MKSQVRDYMQIKSDREYKKIHFLRLRLFNAIEPIVMWALIFWASNLPNAKYVGIRNL